MVWCICNLPQTPKSKGRRVCPLICVRPPLRVGKVDDAGWADGRAEWVQPLFHLQGQRRIGLIAFGGLHADFALATPAKANKGCIKCLPE